MPRMNSCFLLRNLEQTPLAGGARVGKAHRRREEAWRLSVQQLEAVLRGRMRRYVRQAPASRLLDAVQSGCTALSIVKQGDLMVIANVGDSWVVLGTAFDDGAITPSSSSFT
jgi:serine/threonine protein phosphatase PrpC